ncbi:cellulose biosynthesis protein BcsQ [Pseudomonas sp. BJa5]|uniref:cellulose biosynthesis protein BcsQ n=1 Tax=Pseudomonas sp. BJa5 TaxID=2936270 RepID=UPI002559D04C|nr:cellulose biosynthesis protein BcsQ [Pseudomonas sp. BGr12]MDL2420575.1 cellulose biosynthesis protein BcsQ [Pseudomonas sp. BGr12]
MTVVALSGLRGGVGTTSMVAALGFALHGLQQRVLMIDLHPRNLLRLHCNLALDATRGWATAEQDAEGRWSEALFEVVEGLYLLPFGRLEVGALNEQAQEWTQRLQQLQAHFDWILLDMPAILPGGQPGGPALPEPVTRIRVLEADAACHALLSTEGAGDDFLLVNRFDPISQLQRDLLLLWGERQGKLIPQVIHRDEAMACALAWKSPVGYYAPDSLASHDVRSLATWLLAQGAQG